MIYRLIFKSGGSLAIGEETLNRIMEALGNEKSFVTSESHEEIFMVNDISRILLIDPTGSSVVVPQSPDSVRLQKEAAHRKDIGSTEAILERHKQREEDEMPT